MIALVDFIVTLPNHLGQMECKLLNHWQLVGYTRQGFSVFDLATGTLKPSDQTRLQKFVRPLSTTIGDILVTKSRTFIKYEEADLATLIEHETFPGATDSFKAIMLAANAERFLRSLAEFQVDGDEIAKGLKALGVSVEVKIRKNYLGGWMITNSDSFTSEENQRGITCLIEDFVIALAKRGEKPFRLDVLARDSRLYESKLMSS